MGFFSTALFIIGLCRLFFALELLLNLCRLIFCKLFVEHLLYEPFLYLDPHLLRMFSLPFLLEKMRKRLQKIRITSVINTRSTLSTWLLSLHRKKFHDLRSLEPNVYLLHLISQQLLQSEKIQMNVTRKFVLSVHRLRPIIRSMTYMVLLDYRIALFSVHLVAILDYGLKTVLIFGVLSLFLVFQLSSFWWISSGNCLFLYNIYLKYVAKTQLVFDSALFSSRFMLPSRKYC